MTAIPPIDFAHRADASDAHAQSAITGLVSALAAKAGTTGPTFTAVTPEPVFSDELSPALGSRTLAGGASWVAPDLTIPSGGTASCGDGCRILTP
jgi:hypothetical protein